MDNTIIEEKIKTLPIIECWRRYNSGEQPIRQYEHTLYTDANITGDLTTGCGPYAFLNNFAGVFERKPSPVLPAIALRYPIYKNNSSFSYNPRVETEDSLYHGGTAIHDELAALCSLFLSARIKLSGLTREFSGPANDPMGIPYAINYTPPINISPSMYGWVMPNIIEAKNLDALSDLKKILMLNVKESVAFIRAARFYQDALWIGESEPHFAWLMLVSALESVAICYSNESLTTDEEIVSESLPELVKYLEENKLIAHLAGISNIVRKNLFRTTKKFLEFCLNFLPEEPEKRPNKFLQIEWSKDSWEKIFRIIYKYRSKALHEGKPFPLPMCSPPYYYNKDKIPAENIFGIAVSVGDNTWASQDIPINLNLFVIVTRQILLNWLSEIYNIRKV
jgi:hypothetical protein